MHFGATLRLLRIEAGLGLRELASRVGVSSAYLSRVENGHDAPPTPDRLVAIARILGLSPSVLLELGQRVPTRVAAYLGEVPAANELFLQIAERNLSGVQIARIKAFVDREFPAPASAQKESRAVADLLDEERVVLRMGCSAYEDAVDIAALRAADGDADLSRQLADAVMARESEAGAAVGSGLAIPHASLPGLEPTAALVTFLPALDADTPDGAPLKVLLLLTLSEKRQQHSLALLARATRIANSTLIDDIWKARSAREVVRTLRLSGV